MNKYFSFKQQIKSKLFPILLTHLRSNKNVIIQGYPRTLKQAILLQQNGIPLSHLLILNTTPKTLFQACMHKLSTLQHQNSQQTQIKAKQMLIQHQINIKQIKEWYKKYRQIDISGGWDRQTVVRQLHRAFSPLTLSPYPRASTHLLIIGAPSSGRTTLGLRLSTRYSLVYVSSSALLAEEIRKDSVVGRKIKSKYQGKEMIDASIIGKLVQERILGRDCRMQGCALEGYPKTPDQWESMINIPSLRPTMIIALSCPEAVSSQRLLSASKKQNKDKNKDTKAILTEHNLPQRIKRWEQLAEHLRKSGQKIMWINTNGKQVESVYEEVVFELEKGAW